MPDKEGNCIACGKAVTSQNALTTCQVRQNTFDRAFITNLTAGVKVIDPDVAKADDNEVTEFMEALFKELPTQKDKA